LFVFVPGAYVVQGYLIQDGLLKINIATSLVLEASEVLQHFQWTEAFKKTDALAGELADVALYLLQLASVCDIDLEQAILDKVALNYIRTWDEDEQSE